MFIVRKGQEPVLLTNEAGNPFTRVPHASELAKILGPETRTAERALLQKTAVSLHEYMRNYGALSESTKPLIVAGSLIALQDDEFAHTYQTIDQSDENRSPEFGDAWVRAIRRSFTKSDVPKDKIDQVVKVFRSAFESSPSLLQRGVKASVRGKNKTETGSVLAAIVRELEEHVLPGINAGDGFDLIGAFYGEFLRYTAGDKKGLGIVLTPPHVTELFAYLGNPSPADTVLDPCAGTGGFLIAAMKYMDDGTARGVATTEAEKKRIKAQGLMGVEFIPDMYALAASNMLLRGDGKSNLFLGSCFDENIRESLISGDRVTGEQMPRPTIGFINPPYSQAKKSPELAEMAFIKNMLDILTPGSTGIAIVPMSCATSADAWRKKTLESHTLEAVMTMPPELFYGVGTQTVIMVFTAHKPHTAGRKTWFARWVDDGHVTLRGRKDLKGRWPSIRDQWVTDYRTRRADTPGYCVSRAVTATDEWLAEAYMETDYSALADEMFTAVLREFAVYQMMREAQS